MARNLQYKPSGGDFGERIVVPLSFHDSKKYGSYPVLLSSELELRLREKESEFYSIKSLVDPSCSSIQFGLEGSKTVESGMVSGVSVLDGIVRSSGWQMIRQYVEIECVEKSRDLELGRLEMSIPEVRISQRDLWYLERSLIGKMVYSGTSPMVSFDNNNYLQISITGMTLAEPEAEADAGSPGPQSLSGLVTENTNFVIKPRSTRIIMAIILSREFFLYSGLGFEWWKGVLVFLRDYLETNKKYVEHHFLSIILTWRVEDGEEGSEKRDFYEVFWEGVISELTPNTHKITDFVEKLRVRVCKMLNDKQLLKGLVSYCNSNLLECINMALSQLQSDLIDGSLIWSGRNIKILSPGPPVLLSGPKDCRRLLRLARITEVRFLKTSITCDFISFSELDWYDSLNVCILDTERAGRLGILKTIKLRLPVFVYYFRSSERKSAPGLFDLSSTITLMDENADEQGSRGEEEEEEEEEEDIDLVLDGRERGRRTSGNPESGDFSFSPDEEHPKSEFKREGCGGSAFRDLLGSTLLPLTTNMSKIGADEGAGGNQPHTGGGNQRIANWTITPRRELFLAYYWNNSGIIGQQCGGDARLDSKNADVPSAKKRPGFSDANDDVLRLIYYELILHRLTMSFQILKVRSFNNLEHYNAESVQLLKFYSTMENNISPNYDYIHELYLLTEDDNILVQVVNSGRDGGASCCVDEFVFGDKCRGPGGGVLSGAEAGDSGSEKALALRGRAGTQSACGDGVSSYKYSYYLCGSKFVFEQERMGDADCDSSAFFRYYTVFNSLSNVNYNYVDELLVWQREVPFICDLVNESQNELINYNCSKDDPENHYLCMSYISGLSIKYFHFSIIPFFDENGRFSPCGDLEKPDSGALYCYSNGYGECCIDSILNYWLRSVPAKSDYLRRMIDSDCELRGDSLNSGRKSDLDGILTHGNPDKDERDSRAAGGSRECSNVAKLRGVSCENAKTIIKILEQFFFYNAPKDHPRKLNIEVNNGSGPRTNRVSSTKVLSSWCNILRWRNVDKNINYKDCKNNLNPINWFVLHYDSVWNPLIPYKVSICWLACPVFIISRIFKKISSILLNHSFSLIQIKSSNVYLAYDYSNSDYLSKGHVSSCLTLNPPAIYSFKSKLADAGKTRTVLKKLISRPLFLQLISFNNGRNDTPRFFLMEPHSIYSLELNENSVILRLNYYQHFWKLNFKNDSGPTLKCACYSSCYDKNWRNDVFRSHLEYIKEIVAGSDAMSE